MMYDDLTEMSCVYIGGSIILSPYLGQGCLLEILSIGCSCRSFPCPRPILHAGEGAIRRDDRKIGKVGMFIALTVNTIPYQMLE